MDIGNLDLERILKWVLIVLVTGFIAQFGKSFATYILRKIRAGRRGEEPVRETGERRMPPEPTLPESPQAVAGDKPDSTLPESLQTVTGGKSGPVESGEGSIEGGKGETRPPVAGDDDKAQAKLRKKALKAKEKEQKKLAKKP